MRIEKEKIADILKRPATLYVIVNLFVSAVGFVRSFIFMRWLGMEELGLISLAQTVMQFLSLFQFGLINGGYRLFALNKSDDQERVNNLLFSYFTLLAGVCLTVWSFVVVSGHKLIMENSLLLVSIVCGILMLMNNWLNNTLIGKQKLASINRINLLSASISVALLPIVKFFGFTGAVIVIVSQPLVFVANTLIQNKDLRPTGFLLDIKLARYVLKFGFIPFLSGIFVLINLQFERWSIAGFLGADALGRFYLVFLYNSLYLLIPVSIQNIFFPKAVNAYERNSIAEFKSLVKKELLVIFAYDALIVIVTVLLLNPAISVLFPNHINNTIYVFYLLPGLIAHSLYEVPGLILNSCVRLKPILYGSLLGSLFNVIAILSLHQMGWFTLTSMAVIKSIVLIIPCMLTTLYIVASWKKITKRND